MRKFAECSMYAAYEVHTEDSLDDFEKAIIQWSDILKVRNKLPIYWCKF